PGDSVLRDHHAVDITFAIGAAQMSVLRTPKAWSNVAGGSETSSTPGKRCAHINATPKGSSSLRPRSALRASLRGALVFRRGVPGVSLEDSLHTRLLSISPSGCDTGVCASPRLLRDASIHPALITPPPPHPLPPRPAPS